MFLAQLLILTLFKVCYSTNGGDFIHFRPEYTDRQEAILGWPLVLTCNQSYSRIRWRVVWTVTISTWSWIDDSEGFYQIDGRQLTIPLARSKFEHNATFACIDETRTPPRGIAFIVTVRGCEGDPCKNGGTCGLINEQSGFPRLQCQCFADYYGSLCENYEAEGSWMYVVWVQQAVIVVISGFVAILVLRKRKTDELVRQATANLIIKLVPMYQSTNLKKVITTVHRDAIQQSSLDGRNSSLAKQPPSSKKDVLSKKTLPSKREPPSSKKRESSKKQDSLARKKPAPKVGVMSGKKQWNQLQLEVKGKKKTGQTGPTGLRHRAATGTA